MERAAMERAAKEAATEKAAAKKAAGSDGKAAMEDEHKEAGEAVLHALHQKLILIQR